MKCQNSVEVEWVHWSGKADDKHFISIRCEITMRRLLSVSLTIPTDIGINRRAVNIFENNFLNAIDQNRMPHNRNLSCAALRRKIAYVHYQIASNCHNIDTLSMMNNTFCCDTDLSKRSDGLIAETKVAFGPSKETTTSAQQKQWKRNLDLCLWWINDRKLWKHRRRRRRSRYDEEQDDAKWATMKMLMLTSDEKKRKKKWNWNEMPIAMHNNIAQGSTKKGSLNCVAVKRNAIFLKW